MELPLLHANHASQGQDDAPDCIKAFKMLKMSLRLYEGSDFAQATKEIAGEAPILTLEGRVYFKDSENINTRLSPEDSSVGV